MNHVGLTGYLPHEAHEAYAPGGARFVVFDLVVTGDPEGCPWRCEIGAAALQAKCAGRLVPGQALGIEARLASRPHVVDGRQRGWIRWLDVTHVEFVRADRGGSNVTTERSEPACR